MGNETYECESAILGEARVGKPSVLGKTNEDRNGTEREREPLKSLAVWTSLQESSGENEKSSATVAPTSRTDKGKVKKGVLVLRSVTVVFVLQAGKGAIALFKKYGVVGVCVYLGIYFVAVAGFFVAASSGWLTADQVKQWVSTFHLEGHINGSTLDRVDTVGGRLLVAWIATKVIEPLRLLLAVTVTPSVARFLRRRLKLKR